VRDWIPAADDARSRLIGVPSDYTRGGDTWLPLVDDDHLALYLIEVKGHGLDAALLSVSGAKVSRAGRVTRADIEASRSCVAKTE